MPPGWSRSAAPYFAIRVVAEVGALVQETDASAVDDDPERVGVPHVACSDAPVPGRRRVHVPRHGVAPAPLAVGPRTDVERHPDAVAGVELGTPDLDVAPSRSEVLRPFLPARLEATGGEHDGPCADAFSAIIPTNHDTRDAVAGMANELLPPGTVPDVHAGSRGTREQPIHVRAPSASELDCCVAPEAELAFGLERLAPRRRRKREPGPHGPQPAHRAVRLFGEEPREVGIRLSLRKTIQIALVVRWRVAPDFEPRRVSGAMSGMRARRSSMPP